jgi:unsaturated rhamnogalacturonyl hydrolase
MKALLQNQIARVASATIDLMRSDYENFEPEIHRWDWMPGVGLYGLIRAYEILGDRTYLDYCKTYIDRLLDQEIVSYSVNGAVVFEIVLKLYEHTGEARYREELRYFLRWLLRSATKCQNDCFEHSWTEVKVHLVEQVWIDTMFMTGIVLADSYRLFQRPDCRDEVILQFRAHQQALQDSTTGLYRHLYETTTKSYMAGAFWGRGNGWMAASAVEIFDAIGADAPGLVASFQQQMAAARPLQEPDGAFHTILNDPATYREMSATAALGYAALKGVRLGLLDPALRTMGEKAVQAILPNIKETGIVDNVSSGTAGFIPYEHYNQIPIAPRLYGQALTILLLAEYYSTL